jgi:hypothetical protein
MGECYTAISLRGAWPCHGLPVQVLSSEKSIFQLLEPVTYVYSSVMLSFQVNVECGAANKLHIPQGVLIHLSESLVRIR